MIASRCWFARFRVRAMSAIVEWCGCFTGRFKNGAADVTVYLWPPRREYLVFANKFGAGVKRKN
jgi:hypothetical protein